MADLNNAVVSMVSTWSQISKSSRLFTNLLEIVTSAPITIGITVTFMFLSSCVIFFSYLSRSRCLSSFRFISILLYDLPGQKSSPFGRFIFFFFFFFWLSLELVEIRCIIVFILLLWEFFTLALADGFWLGFEWQQISSSFLGSSQYSGRSFSICSLNGRHSSSNSQVLQSLYQSFDDCTKSTN